ncbi:MAG TPA: hypothetical protein VIL55_08655 [Naasia sp.]|jgi:hypothetical protein
MARNAPTPVLEAAVEPEEEVQPDPVPVFDEVPAKKAPKPQYMVVGDHFYGQTDEGEIRIPLRFRTKIFRAIRDAGDEVDQLFALLDNLGEADTAAKFDELDVLDTMEFATVYFQAWQEKNEARLGEARRSSKK